MGEDQILVNRTMFLRLVDQYLLNRIRWLHAISTMPSAPLVSYVDASEKMNQLENLRDEFKNAASGTDFAVSFLKLQSTFDAPSAKP